MIKYKYADREITVDYLHRDTITKIDETMARYIDAQNLNGYAFGLISPYAQNLFHKIINETPTEDVKPIIHGYWKWNNGEYVCSVCDGISLRHKYPYCPWCNAEMDEKEMN